ncbi:MAG: hypothetical protein C0504_12605 [Candidatus Solibacter sp.]|nr:hypothetical protein [Candidatus Solibacter sp.]
MRLDTAAGAAGRADGRRETNRAANGGVTRAEAVVELARVTSPKVRPRVTGPPVCPAIAEPGLFHEKS